MLTNSPAAAADTYEATEGRAGASWRTLASHRAWLDAETRRLLEAARGLSDRAIEVGWAAAGGFVYAAGPR